MAHSPLLARTLRLALASFSALVTAPLAFAAPPAGSANWLDAPAASMQLAMMDDMDEMSHMKKMSKMPDKNTMKKNNMGKMKDDNMPMGGSMNADPMAAPSDIDMMGRMRSQMRARDSMKNMAASAALPGFPGSSHLYHIGASGFFLDQDKIIALSAEQQTSLGKVRERANLERATSDRKIDEAEQELWILTSADVPDTAAVDGKVRVIEKLRADQRIAFIRQVGEAANVLTSIQRDTLVGKHPMTAPGAATTTPPKADTAKAAPAKTHAPASDATTVPAPMKMH